MPDPMRPGRVAAPSRRWSPAPARAASTPNIRGQVNTDTKTLAESDKSFISGLIFWQDSPPPGVLVDPAQEQQRIRDAQASGQPAAGPTPTITRRKRGLLEGIF